MTIEATLMGMGFTLDSKKVRDDFNGRDGSTTWAVTIVRNGQSLQVEYSMGAAHRHYRGGQPIQLPYSGQYNKMTTDMLERNKRSIPNKPTLTGVLYSVVSDAQCVAYGQTFADFAAELGYDEDSRTAEKAYNGCRDEFFGLKRLGANLDELSELFQDY
jgi:hypothetical protein